MKNIGLILKDLMISENIKSTELAAVLGMNEASLINNWIKGACVPSYSYAIKLADFFNISLDYLFGRTEDFSKSKFKPTPPFYQQLVKVMEEFGKTQYKLIKDKIVQVNSFHKWNKLSKQPKMESLIKIADYLGISLDYLVGRE